MSAFDEPKWPRSVLCPVDFSDNARHALAFAVGLAGRSGARLTVLAVNEPFLVEAAAVAYDAQYLEQSTVAELRVFVSSVIPAGAPWAREPKMVVAAGDAPHEILRHASLDEADVIVMGTHGLGGYRKFFFGSTTERVLGKTRTPVLALPLLDRELVRLGAEAPTLDLTCIVAPVDFGGSSSHDARFAAGLARSFGVPLLMVHVVPAAHAAPAWKDHLEAHTRVRLATARQRLEELAGKLGPGQVETLVTTGRPAEEIAVVAAERGAGLIVMGLRGAGGLLQPAPGSIAYRVLTLAAAPVLALPPPAA